jgi:nucleotide-binding universal stress UspA family protein
VFSGSWDGASLRESMKILVGYDGSQHAEKASNTALDLAVKSRRHYHKLKGPKLVGGFWCDIYWYKRDPIPSFRLFHKKKKVKSYPLKYPLKPIVFTSMQAFLMQAGLPPRIIQSVMNFIASKIP